MKRFKYLRTFEAYTPPPPPVDSSEYVIQRQDLTNKQDTFKLSDYSKYIKGSTEKTLDTLQSLNLVEGQLYNCIFDDDLTGEIYLGKKTHELDFRDLKGDADKYIQLHNFITQFKLRVFNSSILKNLYPEKFSDIKDGSLFMSFEAKDQGSYIIYVTADGVPHLTNISDKLEFSGQ